jgi:hypothetical protein
LHRHVPGAERAGSGRRGQAEGADAEAACSKGPRIGFFGAFLTSCFFPAEGPGCYVFGGDNCRAGCKGMADQPKLRVSAAICI